MSDFFLNVFINIVSNLIFWLAGGLMVGILLSRKRRRLHHFFGISKARSLVVYLASLVIEPDTVKDRFGVIRGHSGIAIPSYEFQAIPKISSLFSSTPLDLVPELFSGLVDALWLAKQPPLEFLPSPQKENDLIFTNAICVGGSKFNSATDYYLRTGKAYFSLSKDAGKWEIRVRRGSRTGELIYEPRSWDIGFVQKIYDVDHQSTVFITAGLGVNATRAAVIYLADKWEELYDQYGDSEFGIAFRCPDFSVDQEGYKRLEILMRLPK